MGLFNAHRANIVLGKPQWPLISPTDRVAKVTILHYETIMDFRSGHRLVANNQDLSVVLNNCQADSTLWIESTCAIHSALNNPHEWIPFFASGVDKLTIGGTWRRYDFYNMCQVASAQSTCIFIHHCYAPSVKMTELKHRLNGGPIATLVVDTRQWRNATFMHNFKHAADLKYQADSSYDYLTLIVKDMPRRAAFADAFGIVPSFIRSRLLMIVDDYPDNAYIEMLNFFNFKPVNSFLFGDEPFFMYEVRITTDLESCLFAIAFKNTH